MSHQTDKCNTEPYSAKITVTFDGADYPFTGMVYNQGDGNHVVFHWPPQPNTEETRELAEFMTQTKWVTKGGKCVESHFADDDQKFVCMVSHKGYKMVKSNRKKNEYLSSDGIRSTYMIDEEGRQVISSIVFEGARIDFDDVKIEVQKATLFTRPC